MHVSLAGVAGGMPLSGGAAVSPASASLHVVDSAQSAHPAMHPAKRARPDDDCDLEHSLDASRSPEEGGLAPKRAALSHA